MTSGSTMDQSSPPSKVTAEVLKHLTADIKDVYFDGQQPDHVGKDKRDICRLFEEYINGTEFCRKMANLGLEVISITPFGSSATPLASKSGDLDLCIWLKPMRTNGDSSTNHRNDKDDSEYNPNLVLRELLSKLRATRLGVKQRGWKAPHQIRGAKVPIVKAHIYGYDIDVSVHIGDLQHPNTCAARLIQAYHLYNPNFVALCFYIKEWFKYVIDNEPRGVSSAESVLPNSYTIVLLVAQFMQQKNLLPKLLGVHEDNFFLPSASKTFPNLRGDCAVTDEDISSFRTKYEKELSEELGLTFYRFLDYLTTEVDFKKSVLLVESAEFVPADTVSYEGMKSHEMMIIDVFDKFNPGRRVKTADGFVDFLRDAKRRLENAHNASRVSDRLYDMTIDFKLIERTNRLNLKNAKNSFEVQALTDQLRDIVGEEKEEHVNVNKKNNRPGNAERKRKQLQLQQQQGSVVPVALPPELAPDGEPILPSRAAQPVKSRSVGGRFGGNRQSADGRNTSKPMGGFKRNNTGL